MKPKKIREESQFYTGKQLRDWDTQDKWNLEKEKAFEIAVT